MAPGGPVHVALAALEITTTSTTADGAAVDGAAEGAAEGAADGAADGAAEGAAEGAADGAAEGGGEEPKAVSSASSAGLPSLPLPPDLLLLALSYLEVPTLSLLSRAGPEYEWLCRSYNLVARRELICFHSKLTFEEDILGIGLRVEYFPNGTLKSVSSELDVLSASAFDSGVRTGVWGQPFTSFLPLVLNPLHAERGFKRMCDCIALVAAGVPTEKHRGLVPVLKTRDILAVLTALMNTTVVQLMLDARLIQKQNTAGQREDAVSASRTQRHASEKALAGYCAFHHILLYMAARFPAMRAEAQATLAQFVRTPDARHKSVTPDLGRMLLLLTLSDATLGWTQISIIFLKEAFARNVRWTLKEHPSLAMVPSSRTVVDSKRLALTLAATRTSQRLIMFQVYFLNSIGRPAGQNPASILAMYHRCLGTPSDLQKDVMRKACVRICALGEKADIQENWNDFFDAVLVQRPPLLFLSNLLADAVVESEQKGYHRRGGYRGHGGGYRGRGGGGRGRGDGRRGGDRRYGGNQRR